MRLKHGEHPFPASRSRSLQCSANFGRVMRVIVNEQKALALIFDFKPASRVLEFTKRSCNFFERNSKLDRERNHSEGIVDIVRPWHAQHGLAEFLLPKINTTIRDERMQVQFSPSIIRSFRKP